VADFRVRRAPFFLFCSIDSIRNSSPPPSAWPIRDFWFLGQAFSPIASHQTECVDFGEVAPALLPVAKRYNLPGIPNFENLHPTQALKGILSSD
jgi:hypothetical protein